VQRSEARSLGVRGCPLRGSAATLQSPLARAEICRIDDRPSPRGAYAAPEGRLPAECRGPGVFGPLSEGETR
jgi:hypothetical protein